MQAQQSQADQTVSQTQAQVCDPSQHTVADPCPVGMQGSTDANSGAAMFGSTYNAQASKQCTDAYTACTTACKSNQAGMQACDLAKKNGDAAKDQAKSDGKMPQMPQMPQDNSPSNNPSPLATLDPPKDQNGQCSGSLGAMNPCCNPDGTANTTKAGCGTPQQQADATKPGFATPSADSGGGGGGGGGTGTGTDTSGQPQQTADSAKPSLPGAPSGGSGGLGQGGKANGDQKERSYSLDGDKTPEVLQGERSGGGGGGGFSYAAGETAKELSDYLPGHAKDPLGKRGPAGQMLHPDVASRHEDIFAIISKRYQILCGLKELRDCNAPMSTSSSSLSTVAPPTSTHSGPPKRSNLPMSGPTYIRRSE